MRIHPQFGSLPIVSLAVVIVAVIGVVYLFTPGDVAAQVKPAIVKNIDEPSLAGVWHQRRLSVQSPGRVFHSPLYSLNHPCPRILRPPSLGSSLAKLAALG